MSKTKFLQIAHAETDGYSEKDYDAGEDDVEISGEKDTSVNHHLSFMYRF